MNEHRLKELIARAMRPVEDVEPKRDLWPEMLQRIDQQTTRFSAFDWVLAAAVLVWIVLFPQGALALLYHL